jgi:pimeloyl-ACP methyl ester carboxylesterase
MPQTAQFHFRQATLAYTKVGQGEEVWLAFHGFGQNHEAYLARTESFPERITLYSFDLFHHGHSHWGYEERPVKKEFWSALMREFFLQQGISQFSITAYSLGARFALSLMESFPDRIIQVHLLAPDGIHTDFWYALATQPWLTRKLFAWLVKNPALYFKFLHAAGALNIMPQARLHFAGRQMDTMEKRRQVYFSWVTFRHLTVHPKKLALLLQQYGISLELFLAVNDQVINNRKLIFKTAHHSQVNIRQLNCNHNRLLTTYLAGHFMSGNRGFQSE